MTYSHEVLSTNIHVGVKLTKVAVVVWLFFCCFSLSLSFVVGCLFVCFFTPLLLLFVFPPLLSVEFLFLSSSFSSCSHPSAPPPPPPSSSSSSSSSSFTYTDVQDLDVHEPNLKLSTACRASTNHEK